MRILVVNDELIIRPPVFPDSRISWRDTSRCRATWSRWSAPFETDATRAKPCGWAAIVTFYSNYRPRFRAWRGLYNPQTVPKFRAILARTKPDIVHFHNIHSHLSFACFAWRAIGRPCVPDRP
jgi:hypothetical protein